MWTPYAQIVPKIQNWELILKQWKQHVQSFQTNQLMLKKRTKMRLVLYNAMEEQTNCWWTISRYLAHLETIHSKKDGIEYINDCFMYQSSLGKLSIWNVKLELYKSLVAALELMKCFDWITLFISFLTRYWVGHSLQFSMMSFLPASYMMHGSSSKANKGV